MSSSRTKIPVYRTSTAQLAVPALKRSNSQSSIPIRHSRSSVRGTSQGHSSRMRAKSLASKSPSCTNYLTINNKATGKSGSYSNLRDVTTPVQEKQELTPFSCQSKLSLLRSGSTGKDKRPINDKDWQRIQFIKIKSFLLRLDPTLPPIKPLTVATFVYVMNLVLKEFDDRIQITTDNYKEEVIRYLKIYSYPGIIQPSLIKNISAPHEFPKLIAIWSWLLDKVELLRMPNNILYPCSISQDKAELYHILLSYNIEKFKLWNDGKETGADENLMNTLCAYYNIHDKDIEEQKVELEKLNARYEELLKTKANLNMKDKIAELIQTKLSMNKAGHEYLQNQKEYCDAKKLQKADTIEKLHRVKELLTVQESVKQELKNQIALQKYCYAASENLKKDVQETYHSMKLHQDRLDEKKKLVSDYDLRLSEVKMKLETTIHGLNNKISKLSLIQPDLKGLLIRETGFSKPDMLIELSEVVKKKEAAEKCLKMEFKEVENEYDRQLSLYNEKMSQKVEVVEETEKLILENELLKTQFDALAVKYELEIANEKASLGAMNKELSHLTVKEDKRLIDRRKNIAESAKRLAFLKEKRDRHIADGIVFFKSIANTIIQTAASQRLQQEAITNAILEASTFGGVCEERNDGNLNGK